MKAFQTKMGERDEQRKQITLVFGAREYQSQILQVFQSGEDECKFLEDDLMRQMIV